MRFADLRGMSFSVIVRHRHFWVFSLSLLTLLYCDVSWALQRHTLIPGQTDAGHAVASPSEEVTHGGSESHNPSAAQTHEPASSQPAESGSHSTDAQPFQPAPLPSQVPSGASEGHGTTMEAPKSHSLLPAGEVDHGAAATSPQGLPEHGEEAAVHGEHGVVLPQISPIPGVTFVSTMINLMEHELSGRTLGWRPNDIIIGRFTDNINNFQLGVLEAMRFTTLRLKDSLTRMGDADAYDPDLEAALNLLMNRATLFWFPSAESSYREAVDHLKNFLLKLESGQRHFYYRSDNLLLLLSSYRDLLGNVNRNLIRANVSWFESDDYFYYAKGVAHVYYEILKVVRVGFESQIATTLDAVAMMDEILHELYRAEQMDPWLVMDSNDDSFFANHRSNLNAPLSEVAHLLVVMSQL